MARIVIALGGNALQRDQEAATAENQLRVIAETSEYIVDMIEDGYEVVIVHGNGPQVGRIVQQNDFAASVTPAMPFDICGAMSQGMIGYQIQQCLQNALNRRALNRQVATVVTQVEVDAADPGFCDPVKPVGRFYQEADLPALRRKNPDFVYKEDAGRGWRRVVASPAPRRIVEIPEIRSLIQNGFVTVAAGGGGVPVICHSDGSLHGIDAVVDKDLSAELLAESLDADILLILTAVEQVYIHYGRRDQMGLSQLTPSAARQYMQNGEFAAGSMLPKVEAAVKFVESRSGRRSMITSLKRAKDTLCGRSGTLVAEAAS